MGGYSTETGKNKLVRVPLYNRHGPVLPRWKKNVSKGDWPLADPLDPWKKKSSALAVRAGAGPARQAGKKKWREFPLGGYPTETGKNKMVRVPLHNRTGQSCRVGKKLFP